MVVTVAVVAGEVVQVDEVDVMVVVVEEEEEDEEEEGVVEMVDEVAEEVA